MLPVLYGMFLVWQLCWLVQAWRGKGWGRLLVLNIAATVLAFGVMWYFDTLPGYGMMPGWAYFAEVFYSLCAGVVYFLLTLISALCALIRKK